MKIPKKFQVFGETITVTFSKDLSSGEDKIGQARLRENKLILQMPDEVYPKDKIEQAFFHELVHIILDHIHEPKMSGNEAFVDRFASLLHQATKTMEY